MPLSTGFTAKNSWKWVKTMHISNVLVLKNEYFLYIGHRGQIPEWGWPSKLLRGSCHGLGSKSTAGALGNAGHSWLSHHVSYAYCFSCWKWWRTGEVKAGSSAFPSNMLASSQQLLTSHWGPGSASQFAPLFFFTLRLTFLCRVGYGARAAE